MNNRSAPCLSEPLDGDMSFYGVHTLMAAFPRLLYLRRQLNEQASIARARFQSLTARHELLLRVGQCESELREMSIMVDLVVALERDRSPAAKSMRAILEERGNGLLQALEDLHVDFGKHPLNAKVLPVQAHT